MTKTFWILMALASGSVAFAEEKKETPAPADRVIEAPKKQGVSVEGLFDRVKSAHARAVQRGVLVSPRS